MADDKWVWGVVLNCNGVVLLCPDFLRVAGPVWGPEVCYVSTNINSTGTPSVCVVHVCP